MHGITEHHVWDSFNKGTALRALSLGGFALGEVPPERIPCFFGEGGGLGVFSRPFLVFTCG